MIINSKVKVAKHHGKIFLSSPVHSFREIIYYVLTRKHETTLKLTTIMKIAVHCFRYCYCLCLTSDLISAASVFVPDKMAIKSYLECIRRMFDGLSTNQ